MRNLFIGVIGTFALSGCATVDDATMARAAELASREVVCASEDECEIMWGRALNWVVEHSTYRIQMQTDNLIQTYGPSPNSPAPAYMISKIPLGEGRYRIDFRAGCDNMFGCQPDTTLAHGGFNAVVLGLG